MTKKERQVKVQNNLAANELLYDGKLHIKRVMNPSELFELSRSLGSCNREILSDLAGGVNQHSLKSLIKSNVLKTKRTFGIGSSRAFNGLYTDKLDTGLLENWFMLSKAAWFMREKGLRLGKFSRIKDSLDLETVASFDGKTINKLQLKVVDDLTTNIGSEQGRTLVAVFPSFELMAEAINEHRNLFTKPIEDGCLMLCIRQVEDFETIQGYALTVKNQNGKSVAKLTSIEDNQSLALLDFKQATQPTGGIINQLNWEYGEALERNKQIKVTKQLASK